LKNSSAGTWFVDGLGQWRRGFGWDWVTARSRNLMSRIWTISGIGKLQNQTQTGPNRTRKCNILKKGRVDKFKAKSGNVLAAKRHRKRKQTDS